MSGPSIAMRLKLGLGKVRRFYLLKMNRRHVRRNHARRRGECRRCGSCCKLMLRCPFLDEGGDLASCTRHEPRHCNCRAFPIDERDIADRNRVSSDGPCGYRFEPPNGPQRWLVWIAAALVGVGGLSAAPDAWARSSAEALKYSASFRGERLPELWYDPDEQWRPHDGGRIASGPGELRTKGLRLGGDDVRIEIWGELPATGAVGDVEAANRPLLAVARRWLRAAVWTAGGRTVRFGQREPVHGPFPAPRGRFKLVVECDRGRVTMSCGRRARAVWREVFRDTSRRVSDDIHLVCRAGVVVRAIRVTRLDRPPRPEPLASGDALYIAKKPRKAAVSYGYALAAGEDDLAGGDRAEAHYKLGLCLAELGEMRDAARSWDRAQRLDAEGPWGERARIALGRAALDAKLPVLGLMFAYKIAASRAPEIEDWAALCALVTDVRKDLAARGLQARATLPLFRTAEHLEWAGSARARVLWAWRGVAASYEDRGWTLEAEAVRERALRRFGARERPEPSAGEADEVGSAGASAESGT